MNRLMLALALLVAGPSEGLAWSTADGGPVLVLPEARSAHVLPQAVSDDPALEARRRPERHQTLRPIGPGTAWKIARDAAIVPLRFRWLRLTDRWQPLPLDGPSPWTLPLAMAEVSSAHGATEVDSPIEGVESNGRDPRSEDDDSDADRIVASSVWGVQQITVAAIAVLSSAGMLFFAATAMWYRRRYAELLAATRLPMSVRMNETAQAPPE